MLSCWFCAELLAGCDEWKQIEQYCKSKIDFLKTFLKLPNGISSHDTFGDILPRLILWLLKNASWSGLQGLSTQPGRNHQYRWQTGRGSYDTHEKKAAIHTVSAWANQNRLVLRQIKVYTKSNQLPAIPLLIKALALKYFIARP